MLILPGRAALSAARRGAALVRARSACPGVTTIDARWVHVVASERELTGGDVPFVDLALSPGNQIGDGIGVEPE